MNILNDNNNFRSRLGDLCKSSLTFSKANGRILAYDDTGNVAAIDAKTTDPLYKNRNLAKSAALLNQIVQEYLAAKAKNSALSLTSDEERHLTQNITQLNVKIGNSNKRACLICYYFWRIFCYTNGGGWIDKRIGNFTPIDPSPPASPESIHSPDVFYTPPEIPSPLPEEPPPISLPPPEEEKYEEASGSPVEDSHFEDLANELREEKVEQDSKTAVLRKIFEKFTPQQNKALGDLLKQLLDACVQKGYKKDFEKYQQAYDNFLVSCQNEEAKQDALAWGIQGISGYDLCIPFLLTRFFRALDKPPKAVKRFLAISKSKGFVQKSMWGLISGFWGKSKKGFEADFVNLTCWIVPPLAGSYYDTSDPFHNAAFQIVEVLRNYHNILDSEYSQCSPEEIFLLTQSCLQNALILSK